MIRTIGHSNHPVERFVALLTAAGIRLLVDVRSTPYSRRFPQVGRERLARTLAEAHIDYLWEGAALGGKPSGGDSYDSMATRPDFVAALARLTDRDANTPLCLMCAEKEPLDCHRTLLVSRRLVERGAAVEHLLADGGRRPHREIENALLAGTAGPDLFDDRSTRLARAYAAREAALKGTGRRRRPPLVSGAS